MNNEMTPGLLALLSPEQREAWERCEKATPGPHQARFLYRMIRLLREHGLEYGLMPGDDEGHDWADADLWANAVSDLPAALLELAQAKAELAELRAAVDAAPHVFRYCESHACDCWKSRLTK